MSCLGGTTRKNVSGQLCGSTKRLTSEWAVEVCDTIAFVCVGAFARTCGVKVLDIPFLLLLAFAHVSKLTFVAIDCFGGSVQFVAARSSFRAGVRDFEHGVCLQILQTWYRIPQHAHGTVSNVHTG